MTGLPEQRSRALPVPLASYRPKEGKVIVVVGEEPRSEDQKDRH
jgi:hypothetical protein